MAHPSPDGSFTQLLAEMDELRRKAKNLEDVLEHSMSKAFGHAAETGSQQTTANEIRPRPGIETFYGAAAEINSIIDRSGLFLQQFFGCPAPSALVGGYELPSTGLERQRLE